MAAAAAEQCALQEVLLIPASRPPHRQQGTYASYEDRFRMVEIACAGSPLLRASRLEEGPEVSYSIDTVERYLESAADREVFFVIGADAFADLRSWRRWEDLAKLVTFAVVGRPGAVYDVPDGVRVRRVDGVNLPVSSSDIRSKLAAGEGELDLPAGVMDYIREGRLYGLGSR
jgi:nicotinate-nucleotide adenylyltransferase